MKDIANVKEVIKKEEKVIRHLPHCSPLGLKGEGCHSPGRNEAKQEAEESRNAFLPKALALRTIY